MSSIGTPLSSKNATPTDPVEYNDVETGIGHDLPEKANAEGENDHKADFERKITGIKVRVHKLPLVPNIDFFLSVVVLGCLGYHVQHVSLRPRQHHCRGCRPGNTFAPIRQPVGFN